MPYFITEESLLRNKLAAAEKTIAELRAEVEKLSWKPITPESSPKVGDELYRNVGEEFGGITVQEADDEMDSWIASDYAFEYWTHYRPINPPASTKGKDKEK